MRCIVQNCENSLKHSNVLMFKFPKNNDKKAAWMEALSLTSTDLSPSLKVCFLHFKPEYLYAAVGKRRTVCAEAIPSLNLGADKENKSTNQHQFVHGGNSSANFSESSGSFNKAGHSKTLTCESGQKSGSYIPQSDINNLTTVSTFPRLGAEKSPLNISRPKSVKKTRYNSPSSSSGASEQPLNALALFESPASNSSLKLNKSPLSQSSEVLSDITSFSQLEYGPRIVAATVETTPIDYFVPIQERQTSNPEAIKIKAPFKKITIKRAMTTTEDDIVSTPSKTIKRKEKLLVLRKEMKKKNKKIHNLNRNVKRKFKKISNLSNILNELNNKNLIETETNNLLSNFNGPLKAVLERELFGKKRTQYSPELRKFALNLNFYSPKAYRFVRESFSCVLPHSSTISKWYNNKSCKPGFTSEAFDVLKEVVKLSNNLNQKLFCNLVFDEIAIRSKLEIVGENTFGYVDIGDGEETDEVANQILVFMLVCVNKRWKIPVGYFAIKSLNAEQKSNLITLCLENILSTGINVIGITFDGAATNFSACNLLGCDFDISKQKFTFLLENKLEQEFVIFPDPCHNLKLVRNVFCECSPIYDNNKNIIDWKYITLLLDLQEAEGLHLANNLRKAHVYFQRQKMKVRLATQTLSNSVATAIDFCREVLKLEDFKGSEATTKFIRNINNCFDCLNSQTISGYGLKKVLSKSNYSEIEGFINVAVDYLKELTLSNGKLIIESRRKTGFLGLIVCLKNLKTLYIKYIQNNLLVFIPTYKLNQDHVELFFGTIRSRLGCNNNPSVNQFMRAYRQLLIHCQIRDTSLGNCLPQETIDILKTSSAAPFKSPSNLKTINSTTCRASLIDNTNKYDEELEELNFPSDHDYIFDPQLLTEYSSQVVKYIAGFIVYSLSKKLKCESCE